MSSSYHSKLLTISSSAALAGHGLSLCPNYTHPSECHIDDLQDVYYIVEYEKASLFAYHTLARGAYYVIDRVQFDLNLGYASRHNNSNERYYWASVRQLLLRPLLETMYEIPSKIVLVGDKESVDDPVFRRVLGEVLAEFFKENIPEVIDGDPEYVQAKGVADFVRRRPYLPKPVKPEILNPKVVSYGRENLAQKFLGGRDEYKIV